MRRNKKRAKGIIKTILLMIIGLGYMVKFIFKTIDTQVPKIFMQAPRCIRQFIIYTMVALSITCFIGILKEKSIEVPTPIEVIEIEPVEEIEETNVEMEINPKDAECDLSNIECAIFYEALNYGLNQNQAYMVMAISKQETGHWKSDAYMNYNNLGGIMNSNGLRTYDSITEGIQDMVSILKNYYFDKGLDTLEKIQKKYCPIGASNDPNGLNNYWLKNTTIFYNEYLGGK